MTDSSHNEYLNNWLKDKLFHSIPVGIAIMDKDYNLIKANSAFEQMFGKWKNKKCYTVFKDREKMCPECKGAYAFKDGVCRITQEVGYNKNGRLTKYIKHTIPVIDDDGSIPYLVEMITDITESEQVKKENQLLFDQVPCNITVLDRNLRIVRNNERLKEKFGDLTGRLCYRAFKNQEEQCKVCPAQQTFDDAQLHTGLSVIKTNDGEKLHIMVTTVPLEIINGKVDLVLEMGIDVTHMLQLEDELKLAHTFMEAMITASMDGIFAVNENREVTIFNESAKRMFNIPQDHTVTKSELEAIVKTEFLDKVAGSSSHVYLPETEAITIDGQKIPVRLVGTKLLVRDKFMGMGFTVQDIRDFKQMEKEKIEAERLAAVGQTVAGLAHGVKNLLSGLEGGLYMLNTGMTKSNMDRIQKGLEMLVRNIERISLFVKEFLTYSKGREIKVKMSEPIKIAEEVVELYAQKAKSLGIDMTHSYESIQPAPIDYEGIHESLTNLVGNAIDACRMSDKKQCRISVRTFEKDDTIIYEVEDDGCGMDYEVKKKVFTNFFTTKGLGGTGLGLLTTKKIIQEHGGTIGMESEVGKGTIFRISLPRKRLPKTIIENDNENDA